MNSKNSSVDVKSTQISLNHGGFLGVTGTPQLIHVNIGEDIISKVIASSQQGTMRTGILCATGDVSRITLRNFAMGGHIVTYEGRFCILSLRGSFLVSEGGQAGGLNMMLSRLDHTIFGGSVAGMLVAATPVQVVVVSSFIPKTVKLEPKGCDYDVPKGIKAE